MTHKQAYVNQLRTRLMQDAGEFTHNASASNFARLQETMLDYYSAWSAFQEERKQAQNQATK